MEYKNEKVVITHELGDFNCEIGTKRYKLAFLISPNRYLQKVFEVVEENGRYVHVTLFDKTTEPELIAQMSDVIDEIYAELRNDFLNNPQIAQDPMMKTTYYTAFDRDALKRGYRFVTAWGVDNSYELTPEELIGAYNAMITGGNHKNLLHHTTLWARTTKDFYLVNDED